MKRYKKQIFTTVFACFLAVLLSVPYAWAQEVGTATYVEGRVEVIRTETDKAIPLAEADSIFIGDVIRTKTNAKAQVTFKDNSSIQLAPSTKVNIKDFQFTKNNKRKEATIELERGKLRALVEKRWRRADFNIHTPNAHGTIKGSDVFVFYQAGSTGMLVAQGQLSVINPQLPQLAPITVAPGNSILLPKNAEPMGPRPYLELEKEFHLQDTSPPITALRKKNMNVIEGKVTKIGGRVLVTPKGETDKFDVMINDILEEGDTLETTDNGTIEVRFDNGNSINLKPNTKLKIVRLVVDTKTKEYENLFEVNTGNVKAVVENIEGGSSFQIKTPQATSGVRGTIMYLVVTSSLTKSFFEGGPGFMESIYSGTIKDVGIGESATADNLGNITDPLPITGLDRTNFSEGFEPVGDGDGDSAAEGNIYGGDAADFESGVTQANTETGNNNNVDIPVTESLTSLLLKNADEILDGLPDFFIVNKTITPRVKVSDFDDGTLQGWTKVEPFDGDLLINEEDGNSNGFMFATDTKGGGVLLTELPDGYIDHLDMTSGLFFDEYIYDNGSRTIKKVGVVIEGSDGTRYISDQTLDSMLETWTNRFVSIDDPSQWTKIEGSGNATFQEVIADIVNIYLSLETANQYNGNLESGIDNVGFLLSEDTNVTFNSLAGDIIRNSANDAGAFGFVANGTYMSDLPDNWQLYGLTGNTTAAGEFVGGSWIAGILGDEWTQDGEFSGIFNGVWIELHKDGTLSGKVMTGDVLGEYVDINEGATWTAASSGEWVEVDALIDLAGFNDDVVNLGTPVVPITEVYTSMLAGVGSFDAGGSITVNNLMMDFFANDILALNGIWAANVSGDFTQPTSDGFSVDVSGNLIDSSSNAVIGTVDATLTGTEWSDGNWQAAVNGNTDTGISLSGQSAGTYDDATGTLSGAGVGTFEQN